VLVSARSVAGRERLRHGPPLGGQQLPGRPASTTPNEAQPWRRAPSPSVLLHCRHRQSRWSRLIPPLVTAHTTRAVPHADAAVGRPAGGRGRAVPGRRADLERAHLSWPCGGTWCWRSPEHGLPVLGTREELTVFRSLDKQNRWHGPFCGSPVRGDGRWRKGNHPGPPRRQGQPGRASAGQAREKPRQGRHPSMRSQMTWWPCLRTMNPRPSKRRIAWARSTPRFSTCWVKLGADMVFEVHVAGNDQGRRRADDLVSL